MNKNTFEYNADIPFPSKGQCGLRRVHSDTVYFVGGIGDFGHISSAYVYSISSSSFRTMAKQMSAGRMINGCTILENEGKLVVSAGFTIGGYVTTVEILDLSTEEWILSPSPLPSTSDFYRFVSYHNTHVAFCCVNYNTGEFGASTYVYRLNGEDISWELDSKSSATLVGGPTNAVSHVAFNVNDAKICHYLH